MEEKVPNEILENYSKKEILKCIKHMLLHRKKLKGVNIKEYMIKYLEEHKNKDWRDKLINPNENK